MLCEQIDAAIFVTYMKGRKMSGEYAHTSVTGILGGGVRGAGAAEW